LVALDPRATNELPVVPALDVDGNDEPSDSLMEPAMADLRGGVLTEGLLAAE
jgi:hypothetical protein